MNDDLVGRLRSIADAFGEMATMGNPFPLSFQNTVNEAISALLAHDAGQAGVVVKPLEWVKHFRANMWRADTIVGLYQVAAIVEPASWTFDGLPGEASSGDAVSGEVAKAAAQADYERRVLSALSAPPAPPEPTGSLVGDAMAAAGQSIGMSVTRVHPASHDPAFVASLTRVKDQLEARPEALRGPFKVDGLAPYVHPEPEKMGEPVVYEAVRDAREQARQEFAPLRKEILRRATEKAPATPPVADARRVEE